MQIVNSTISGNVAPPWADAAIFVGTFTPANASLSLTNSIVAGNTSTGCFAGFFGAGTVTLASGGDNLFSDATCNPVASDIVTAATGLGTFGNHGGPIQTYALLAGSPAIDAANDALCPAEDQRGVARPQGAACDIGSYEFP